VEGDVFLMNTRLHSSVTQRLRGVVDWLTQKRWQIVSAQTTDALYTEIYQLKEALSNAPTRPTRTVRKFESVEPVTEQQKFMDMAG
jgi:hypothetical protein